MTVSPHTISVGGSQRRFLLAEPSGAAGAVVLSLHGTRSSAEDEMRLSRMASLADGAGAVVAFPQAILPIGSGYQWDEGVDTGFLAELVGELLRRYPVPGGRACMTGMSGGARMSCRFAWSHAEMVAMVGAVAGLRGGFGPPPSRPVPVIAFHGTADRLNPYAGSGTERWGESVPEAARQWALVNGLPGEPTETAVSSSLTRTTFGEEGRRGEVTLWTFRGAGHTWPGTRLPFFVRMLLGRTSMEMDATERIWEFAGRHAGDP